LQDGQIELMIHRRLFDTKTTDVPVDDLDLDGKGVVARGKVLLFLDNEQEVAINYRPTSQYIFMQPVIGFNAVDNITKYRNEHRMQFSGLKSPLPDNVHLLTLQNWGDLHSNEVLVRFENFFESSDQSPMASLANFSLDIFENLQMGRLSQSNLVGGSRSVKSDPFASLHPQDIATFVYQAKRNPTPSGRWSDSPLLLFTCSCHHYSVCTCLEKASRQSFASTGNCSGQRHTQRSQRRSLHLQAQECGPNSGQV